MIKAFPLLSSLQKELRSLEDKKKAKILSGFFKTAKGQYGEGDRFLGIKVPDQRKIARKYRDLPLEDIKILLNSDIHEFRMTALLILISRYERADVKERKKTVDFYIRNLSKVNNWDLVDISAPKILGNFLEDKDRSLLYKLADSDELWEKRVSIISTFAFIRKSDFTDTLKISEILLLDKHDLMHKAVGWMLREVGNRDMSIEEKFLKEHYRIMPRTMLRYAIEKFPEPLRQSYLKGRI